MAYHYEIRKKAINPGEDTVLAKCNKRDEIPYELERLGFKDAKTKLDENGITLYYKGARNILYVAYVGNY